MRRAIGYAVGRRPGHNDYTKAIARMPPPRPRVDCHGSESDETANGRRRWCGGAGDPQFPTAQVIAPMPAVECPASGAVGSDGNFSTAYGTHSQATGVLDTRSAKRPSHRSARPRRPASIASAITDRRAGSAQAPAAERPLTEHSPRFRAWRFGAEFGEHRHRRFCHRCRRRRGRNRG